MQDLRKLVQYLFKYKRNVSLSICSHVLMAIFTVISIPLIIPFFQLLFSNSVDNIVRPDSSLDLVGWLKYYFMSIIESHGEERALLFVCALIVLTFLLKNFFRYLAMFFMVPVRSNIVRDLRSGLYLHYINSPLSELKETQRGDLISRITSDVQEVEWSILRFIDAIFKSPIIIVGSIAFMLSINVKLTLFVFILMAFTTIVIGTLSRTLKKQSLDLQSKLASMSSIVDETLDGSIPIKVFRANSYWGDRFQIFNDGFRRIMNKVTWRQDLSSPVSEFLGVSLVVVLLWFGSKMVLQNALASEDFFAFIFAFYNVIEPSKSFATAFYNVRKGAASLQRIDQILQNEHEESIPDGNLDFAFESHIEFKDVIFSYDKEPVLSSLNFRINKGEKVAIVGPSGAGKSTILNILLKLLKPQSGNVYFDNMSLDNIKKESYYLNVGFVSQNPFLFNASISENIKMGRTVADEKLINRSLELSHSKNFISKLENGLNHQIGDRGENLSGGEKQRLTIARALIEDPELLIFDEPTSALDPESEKIVSAAITDALKDRTAIIIAHRLSTIKYADRILVLDSGKIVEQGSHEELLQTGGIYSDYVRIQSIV